MSYSTAFRFGNANIFQNWYNTRFENYEPVEYKHNILFQARFPEIMRIQHEPPNVILGVIIDDGFTK